MKNSYSNLKLEVGCDEAGRGCLIGPVFAASVIVGKEFFHPWLNDSKKLSEKKRLVVREYIIRNCIDYSIAFVDNFEIDKINILNASIKAMHKSIEKLKVTPDFIIVDGNKFKKYKTIEYKTIIKGDSKYISIAAASILAKTERDNFIYKIHNEYPNYGWKDNKGYPTKKHKEAIKKFGETRYQRKTYKY